VIVGGGVGEECLQPVIICLQNRIKLMVMAARATVRQPQVNGAGGIGDVVEDFLAALEQVPCVALVGIMTVEACGDARLGARRPELVACYLLLDEAVVRLSLLKD
jgi:hypothetical protein